MKTFKHLVTGTVIVASTACIGLFIVLTTSFDIGPREETSYTAVIMTRTELENSITYQPPKPIVETGKIYKKGSQIFITEKYKGIHIIDNTNPKQPVKTGFIRIPGCIDIAVKENSLYADNSVDLVTIDISSLPTIKVTNRTANVFPELLPPDLKYLPYKYSASSRPANTVIVEWKKIQ